MVMKYNSFWGYKIINMIHHINKMKDKNNIIISIDDQKPFNKILQTFVIKILSNVRVERTFHNVIKAIYEKPTASTILNGEKKKFLKIRNKTGLSAVTTVIQHSLEVVAITISKEEEIQGIQIGKKEINLSLLTDDMIMYLSLIHI